VPRSIKQIDRLLGKSPDIDSADVAEEWNPPIPEYPFVERARIADTFFGPDAESIDGKRTLARRIQVASDLAALCKVVSAVPSQKAIQLEQRGHGRMHCLSA
jgi:hypothetical protein